MQRFHKYDGMLFGFASGIVGWMSSDLFLQIIGGLATIFGCIAAFVGMVQRFYEAENAKAILRRSETEAKSAELSKQLLENQLKKEA
jgi:uncharacterized membrane protein